MCIRVNLTRSKPHACVHAWPEESMGYRYHARRFFLQSAGLHASSGTSRYERMNRLQRLLSLQVERHLTISSANVVGYIGSGISISTSMSASSNTTAIPVWLHSQETAAKTEHTKPQSAIGLASEKGLHFRHAQPQTKAFFACSFRSHSLEYWADVASAEFVSANDCCFSDLYRTRGSICLAS
jgi:hypothetical protein